VRGSARQQNFFEPKPNSKEQVIGALNMKTTTLSILLFLAMLSIAVQPLWSQGGRIPLDITETINTNEFTSSTVFPAKCDTDGNILVRVHREERYGGAPILRLSPTGKLIQSISIESVPGFGGSWVMDFAPGANVYVYVLAVTEPGKNFILVFDSSGKLKSQNQIQSGVFARQIAELSSGDLLIGGIQTDDAQTKGKPFKVSPFLGIFSGDGQLLRNVLLNKDIVRLGSDKAADRQYGEALAGSSLQTADDGLTYLMRRSPIGPIFAMSAAGVISKRIQLIPPTQHAQLSQIRVAKNFLIAEFIEKKSSGEGIANVILDVVDLQTGTKIREFSHSSAAVGSVVGCYTQGNLSFISNDENLLLTLVTTKVQ
jgi:hypothetical protein